MASKREKVLTLEAQISKIHYAYLGSIQIPTVSPLPSGAEFTDTNKFWETDKADEYISRLEDILLTGKDPSR